MHKTANRVPGAKSKTMSTSVGNAYLQQGALGTK